MKTNTFPHTLTPAERLVGRLAAIGLTTLSLTLLVMLVMWSSQPAFAQ